MAACSALLCSPGLDRRDLEFRGSLLAKGLVQASDVEPVIGAILTIGSVIWSVADKRGR